MGPLLIYGLITVLCGGLLAVMAIFGAESDVDADVDADFDVDADVDVDVADLEAGEFGGPGKLSLRLIMFFLVGFGLAGFIAVYANSPVPHLIVALGGGCVFWFLGYQVLKLLYQQQSNSQIRARSFTGKQARVTVPIPKGGMGEIEATDKQTGRSVYFSARAPNSENEFQKGETVTIRSVAGGTAVVEQKEKSETQ
jgi:membrane protein implicated in regulation of membrane protease activity